MSPRLLLLAALLGLGCTPASAGVELTISASTLGAEGQVLGQQLERFMREHPGIRVRVRPAADAADQRHQLFVQWLAARSEEPDLLQLDVVWAPEFAAAGWILPLDATLAPSNGFFPNVLAASRWQDRQYALPWFVDAGMLYWRTDLMAAAPSSWDALEEAAGRLVREGRVPYGLVFQGARYEGLTCSFLEVLGGHGGALLQDDRVTVDSPSGRAALGRLHRMIHETGTVPPAVLSWQEEQARFAFQNGQAAFMRNWPYAFPLMADATQSRVAGRFAVAPLPATTEGTPTATLGGAQLAINSRTRHPREAHLLLRFLTDEKQMVERARIAGQYPARPALYEGDTLVGALPIPPADALAILSHATPRPVTPLYTELSGLLQVQLHGALASSRLAGEPLRTAAAQMQHVLDTHAAPVPARARPWPLLLVAVLALVALWRRVRALPTPTARERDEMRTALGFILPALVVMVGLALFPLGWTAWESLQHHDLRTPWLGTQHAGLANYAELLHSARFWSAVAHTALFTGVSVSAELLLGLLVALVLHRQTRGLRVWRALNLLPWAIPTVVAALVWRFMFESPAGILHRAISGVGLVEPSTVWFIDATLAWVPVIAADVWKTTPFVALLLLAALQGLDPALYESARIDGASRLQQLTRITLPLLRPTMVVVLLLRALDAFRVFDIIYVMTGGGPGTATEPVALLAFNALLQNLRFGFGSSVSVVIFLLTFSFAALFIRLSGAHREGEGP
ncbi:MAG: extracellular solute-binding protein [Myxococcota bacterium]